MQPVLVTAGNCMHQTDDLQRHARSGN